jgi:beta-lactamase superfamily II metal-dependent hydrolase
MRYEIDFIGLKEHTKDASAVCLRWYSEEAKRYIVIVYDGGFSTHGKALVAHLKNYYFNEDENATIDYVICSHSDDDHAKGLAELFDHFTVKKLIMNRPWRFSDELFPLVSDGRKTKDSVERELKSKYSSIADLEKRASEAGTTIIDGFSDYTFTGIYSPLKILSPTKQMYLDLVVESSKTPYETEVVSESFFRKVVEAVKKIIEKWTSDTLHEDVSTTAENEASIIILGDMESEKFLLTGDAGIRALGAAADFSETVGISLNTIEVHQIPHHGGRHNVSPSILNRVVGQIVNEDSSPTKSAFVSIGKDSDHPKGMVVNAYIRRGVKVFEARASTICHHIGDMPEREGWSSVKKKEFLHEVDDWD